MMKDTQQFEGSNNLFTPCYVHNSGNHERDWPGTSSFYQNKDSGGECGGPTETTYYMPTKNKDKFWYVLLL